MPSGRSARRSGFSAESRCWHGRKGLAADAGPGRTAGCSGAACPAWEDVTGEGNIGETCIAWLARTGQLKASLRATNFNQRYGGAPDHKGVSDRGCAYSADGWNCGIGAPDVVPAVLSGQVKPVAKCGDPGPYSQLSEVRTQVRGVDSYWPNRLFVSRCSTNATTNLVCPSPSPQCILISLQAR